MNEYQLETKRKYEELLKDLKALSDYKWIFEYDDRNNQSYSIYIKLDNGSRIIANPKNYQSKYGFWLRHTYSYVRYNTEKKYKEENKEPQNVGVLNKNKIVAWVEYLKKLDIELKRISEEREKKVFKHLDRVKKNGGNYKLEEAYKTYTGRIEKNGIIYSFQVSDEGYISEKIELSYKVGGYGKDNIKDFLAVSDNRYKDIN